MRFCLLKIGDGRDEVHERSWASVQEHFPQPDKVITIDDRDHSLGFAGAIQKAWDQVPDDADYVFHAELDFIYHRRVEVEAMAEILDAHSHLVQIALKRQPVNEAEKKAGGIVELSPDSFEQHYSAGHVWTEHRRFFTTNPSLYPAALTRHGWPQRKESEGRFGLRLFEDPNARSAFWGGKHDPPLIEHIGERQGVGY